MRIHHLLIFILTATAWLNAEPKPVNVKLSLLSLNARILDLKYESQGKVESLYAYKNKRSKTFDYSGPQTITFFRESKTPDANGQPTRTVVATCKIPKKKGQFLLILSKTEQKKENYKIIPITDDWNGFKPGTYRFLNLAPYDIALKLEDKVHTIKERNFTDITGSFEDDTNLQAIMVSLPDNKAPVQIFEGYIYYTDDLRMLYVIAPKAGKRIGSVEFIAVPQSVKSAK